MQASTTADLHHFPKKYYSPRGIVEVLIGEDFALPLINASSTGDVSILRSLLSQPQWTAIALEKPHCIYYDSQKPPSTDTSEVREVLAMPISNLDRALKLASTNGHAEAVSALLDFASRQGVEFSDAVTRWTVVSFIKNGHVDVLEATAAVWRREIVGFYLSHSGPYPLDLAVKQRQPDMVAALLRLGANASSNVSPKRVSLLCLASRAGDSRVTEILLRHGVPAAQSGALQQASRLGRLDTMRLLLESGADPNELLVEEAPPQRDRSLLASWTPLHFAASRGHTDAVQLLESNGAQPGVEDANGMTPAQLMYTNRQ